MSLDIQRGAKAKKPVESSRCAPESEKMLDSHGKSTLVWSIVKILGVISNTHECSLPGTLYQERDVNTTTTSEATAAHGAL